MIKTFNAANPEWSNAAKNNDATFITNLYHEDAIFGYPNLPFIKGKKDIGIHWQKVVEAVDDLGFETQTLQGNNDIFYETGLAFSTYTLSEKLVIDTSKYLLVWKNMGNGEFSILADVFNSFPEY